MNELSKSLKVKAMKYLFFILIDLVMYPFLLVFYLTSLLFDKIKIRTFVL